MKNLVLAAAVALAAIGAQAQTYAEIGYTSLTYKASPEGDTLKSSPSAIRAIVGYELNENLAVEGMVAMGAGSGKLTVGSTTLSGIKLKVSNVVGVYIKPKLKLNDSVEVFGRLGFSNSKVTASLEGQSSSESGRSVSYGVGMGYALNQKTSVNADYMQYRKKDGVKFNGFTFGVGYKF